MGELRPPPPEALLGGVDGVLLPGHLGIMRGVIDVISLGQ